MHHVRFVTPIYKGVYQKNCKAMHIVADNLEITQIVDEYSLLEVQTVLCDEVITQYFTAHGNIIVETM